MITSAQLLANAVRAHDLLKIFEGKPLPLVGKETSITQLVTIVVYQQQQIESLKRAMETLQRGYPPQFDLRPIVD
jgi:hypothetical protein